MALSPVFFRGLTPSQMAFALLIDEKLAQHTKARAGGKSCVDCLDTGMGSEGRFCSCEAGWKIAYQANKR